MRSMRATCSARSSPPRRSPLLAGTSVVTVPTLREMAMGRWEGLTFAEIRAREPELCDRWLADPFAMPFPGG